MSVLDRSCFSYHVAAGNKISPKRPVLVILKSIETSKSNLPSGASSCHFTSRGLASGPFSSARTELSVPSKCLRKYSLPLLEEPRIFARHTVNTRGQFSGASGSSIANLRFPFFNSLTTCAEGSTPSARASSTRSNELRLSDG
ncbi:unannotated protein [freshwater metagenome]|uniref:Unannotated protein n=1 Tax=freshwater metagenome TaxID=449393 RepID=A0A6J6GD09_9ZZZZ